MTFTNATDSRVKDAAFDLHQATNMAQFAILMVHSYGGRDMLEQTLHRLEAACARARALLATAAEPEEKE